MKHNLISLRTLTAVSLFLGLQYTLRAHDGHGQGGNVPQKYYGKSAQLGAGKVRTYVVLNKDKDQTTGHRPPLEVGVEIPAKIMSSLPPDQRILNFDFPIQARDTAVQFMMMGCAGTEHIIDRQFRIIR